MYLMTSLSANMRNIYLHGMRTGCKSFPLQKHFVKNLNKLYVSNVRKSSLSPPGGVAPGFKDKTRYILYVSPGSQFSHIATNKGNIKRQYLLHNVLVKRKITSEYRQRKVDSDLQAKTPNPQGRLTG